MPRQRLDARLARLEARHARTATPSGLVIVWVKDGDTRASALQKAGLTPAEGASRVVVYVEYEETRPDAL